jgi:hypothetical protein
LLSRGNEGRPPPILRRRGPASLLGVISGGGLGCYQGSPGSRPLSVWVAALELMKRMKMSNSGCLWGLSGVLSVVVSSACSAVIERRGGPSLYAPIHSSDAETIYVEDEGGACTQFLPARSATLTTRATSC